MTNTIWPQIYNMMSDHALYCTWEFAWKQTGRINGPLAEFIKKSYVTTQCSTIRRLIDPRSDVVSLIRVLKELKTNCNFIRRSNFLIEKLIPCEIVKKMTNKFIAHTDIKAQWSLNQNELSIAQKAIIEVAICIDCDILKNPSAPSMVIPVAQSPNFWDELMLSDELKPKIWKHYLQICDEVNGWIPSNIV